MKRTFFIFSVITMVVMAMSFVGCDKHETIEPNPISQEEAIPPSGLKSSANYYPNSAVSYALSWTSNTSGSSSYNNSQYLDYTDYGGDCANFVSQCLHQGGGLYTDATWWTGGLSWSAEAWYNANSLYNYLYNSAYDITTYTITNISSFYTHLPNLQKGDIVFYYNGNRFDHVTIISTKTSQNVYVCGHTKNERNGSLKAYISAKVPSVSSYLVVLHFD